MRLIDADAMHKFVEDKVAEGKDGWANGVCYEWAWTLTAVDMQPTIEAEPVKYGMWFHDINNLYCCSVCLGRETMSHKNPKHYCPNCGAKMDEEGNDAES